MIIGILGGGQLARMLALAGHPLGLKFVVLDPAKDACANVVAEQLCGDYDDPKLLAALAEKADVVTYEFENVPAEAVRQLDGKVNVYPPARALAVAQDRLNEKNLFRQLGIATPDFAAIDSLDELKTAMTSIGYPAVLKTRTQGYDGKGQAVLRSDADLASAWNTVGGVPLIVEAFVPFDREVSVIAARGRDGTSVCYPISENEHREGILRFSQAQPNDPVQQLANDYITRLLDHLDYVGVLALELFQVGNDLLANECAPRVHNSGHWTQNGAVICQFENHLRAIAGLPLGTTETLGHAAMINLIGNIPSSDNVLKHGYAHLHLYGKEERAGRKVGHINVCCANEKTFQQHINDLNALIENN